MSALFFAPLRTPVTDPRTGLMAREWYLFLQGLWLRTGGSEAPSVDDLLQSLSEDLPTSDLQMVTAVADEAFAQLPTVIAQQDAIDALLSTVADLREQLADQAAQIQELRQGEFI